MSYFRNNANEKLNHDLRCTNTKNETVFKEDKKAKNMHSRILLVEDDESLGFVLKAYLRTQDFRVEWVKNGQEGFSLLKKSKFDLCLLDIMMPRMDGMELMQKIRMRKDYIPVIFLTAKALKADKLKGFDLGADDYLVKPIDEEELVARIRAVLRRSKAPKSAESSYQIGQFTFDLANQKLNCPI